MVSRGNIAKRGSTWTYYVYVTDGDGTRRQVSKGGFRTRKQAEAARIEALATINNGTWVEPGRLKVREFLEDEWLPSQRPPTLEESTYRSYQRNIRLTSSRTSADAPSSSSPRWTSTSSTGSSSTLAGARARSEDGPTATRSST